MKVPIFETHKDDHTITEFETLEIHGVDDTLEKESRRWIEFRVSENAFKRKPIKDKTLVLLFRIPSFAHQKIDPTNIVLDAVFSYEKKANAPFIKPAKIKYS